MFILDQRGKNAYNVINIANLYISQDKKDKSTSTVLGLTLESGECRVIARYDTYERAIAVFKQILEAISDGINLFDLNGMLAEHYQNRIIDRDIEKELGELECEIPEWEDAR